MDVAASEGPRDNAADDALLAELSATLRRLAELCARAAVAIGDAERACARAASQGVAKRTH